MQNLIRTISSEIGKREYEDNKSFCFVLFFSKMFVLAPGKNRPDVSLCVT